MSLRQVQIMPLSTMMGQVLSQVVPYGPLVTKEWLRPLQQVQANLTLWLISQEVQGTPLQSLIALENVVATTTATSSFGNVVFSTESLTSGETYTITTSSGSSVTATATEEGTNNGPGAGGMGGSQAVALAIPQ